MDGVTECQWDRALSDGKGTECQWDRTLSDGKGDVMIFGNGIFGTLERTFTVCLERATE